MESSESFVRMLLRILVSYKAMIPQRNGKLIVYDQYV